MGTRSPPKLLQSASLDRWPSAASIRAWPAGGALPWELADTRAGRAGGRDGAVLHLSTPSPSQSCPGLPERRRGRWRAGARLCLLRVLRRWLAGARSPRRAPPRACDKSGTIGSQARRRGRATAVSAVRGAGWGFPEPPLAGAFLRVLWSPIYFSKLPGRNFPSGVWRTLPSPTSRFPRAKGNADAKARLHRPRLRTDGPGSTDAQLHRAALCRGASFQTLGSCMVMGNGFSPGALGGDIFHFAVSPACW